MHHQLAQEVVSRYSTLVDPYVSNCENVRQYLRKPIEAVTLFILTGPDNPASNVAAAAATAAASDTTCAAVQPSLQEEGAAAAVTEEAGVVMASEMVTATQEEKKSDWRDYLAQGTSSAALQEEFPDFQEVDLEAYAALGRRTKARVEAFLNGIAIAVPNGGDSSSNKNSAPASGTSTPVIRGKAAEERDISLKEGLAGFATTAEKRSTFSSLANAGSQQLLRSISTNAPATKTKRPQIAKDELVTRVELYMRSLHRVKCQGQECVIAAEPARAMKARARSIVVAFVDTVDTVQQQSPVLTRLLKYLTQELLAVEYLAKSILDVVHRLVSDYVQSVSFASLAFLTSPETSADTKLTPMVLRYLKFLQANWQNCVMDCELERMLSCCINSELRHCMKTIEFTSIGHLLEVCHAFRKQLNLIEISPYMRVDQDTDDTEALRQALRDLKREVITINGNVLPPVKSRKQLLTLLTKTLNSRMLATGTVKNKRLMRRLKTESSDFSESESDLTSADEKHISATKPNLDDASNAAAGLSTVRRKRNFKLSTVDYLTRRLLLAASRTGTGGDAYFVVRDLFGGDDVEVVPSKNVHTFGRHVRPGSIEIIVKLASVTIKCHGSFDVYPKSLVGEVEPLIQLHTTTSEVIALQEVRATDSSSEGAAVEDEYSSDDSDSDQVPVMVVQERKTDRTGWRTLSIRPALYEQVEEFSTPS